jgi:hypothetical protein
VEEVKKEMKKYALAGFLITCFFLPIMIANKEDAPNFDDFNDESINDDTSFLKLYSSPLFCKRFKEILEDADYYEVFSTYKKLEGQK